MLVTIFSCAERFLGFIYRIFLSRRLGSESLGVYQIALSVFGLLLTVTASGIPITISRMLIRFKTQNNVAGERQTVSSGIFACAIISLPLTLLIIIKPSVFSFLFTDKRCLALLKILIPGLTITSIYAVIRGYFWGNKLFIQYSLIEFIEEFAMLAVGIILVNSMTSTEDGAMRAGLAIVISYVVSFTLSGITFAFKGGRLASPLPQLKPLLTSSLPITSMRTATSLINSLIATVLPIMLIKNGYTQSQALSGYGELSGMTMPLLFIPSTVIGAIALVLVPELSESFYNENHYKMQSNIEKAVHCSVFISCMIIPSFIALGKEIGLFVYNNQTAGIYLSKSAIIMLPMSITMITNSLLNSMNKEKITLLYFTVGSVATVVSILVLPKYLGIYSLVAGYGANYFITCLLNLIQLHKSSKRKPKILPHLLTSVISIISSTLLCAAVKKLLENRLPTIVCLGLSSLSAIGFALIIFYLSKRIISEIYTQPIKIK